MICNYDRVPLRPAWLITEARNGRVLLWKRRVWHLYSFTLIDLFLSLLSLGKISNIELALFRFFIAKRSQISCRRCSSVSVWNITHAREYPVYLFWSIKRKASFWIDSISDICFLVMLECQTGAAYSKIDLISFVYTSKSSFSVKWSNCILFKVQSFLRAFMHM